MEALYENRSQRVLEALHSQGLDQMLISDPDSIWYLTGIHVDPGERLLALYLTQTGDHVLFLNKLFSVPDTGLRLVWMTDTDDQIGILTENICCDRPMGIDKFWPARFLLPLMERNPHMVCRLGSQAVDSVRAVKDETEIRLMEEASRINDEVIEKAAAFVREGMTEKEIADYIVSQYRAAGCESESFPTIVSFAGNAADPHHGPDDTVLKEGDCIVIDMGCRKNRYCSDMTRTFFCKKADPKYAAIHDLVRCACEAAQAAVRPGVVLSHIDAVARDMITEAGYGPFFTHRLGHFIGQQDHEAGDVSASSQIVAQPGMIFSIEPGVYLPGQFGVRVEDLVIVTQDGCRSLNHVDRHWKTIG